MPPPIPQVEFRARLGLNRNAVALMAGLPRLRRTWGEYEAEFEVPQFSPSPPFTDTSVTTGGAGHRNIPRALG